MKQNYTDTEMFLAQKISKLTKNSKLNGLRNKELYSLSEMLERNTNFKTLNIFEHLSGILIGLYEQFSNIQISDIKGLTLKNVNNVYNSILPFSFLVSFL